MHHHPRDGELSASCDLAAEFPILRDSIFFNHASVSPLPLRAAEAMKRYADEAVAMGGAAWLGWAKALKQTRRLAAGLFGVEDDEIAFTPNTTHGLLCVANSLPWRPGDNIVTADREFPANVYPWRNLAGQGVAVRAVPEQPDRRYGVQDFVDRMDARTRLVAISLVQFSTGYRMPVEAIAQACRERGILLCLDGIQAAGALPVFPRELGCDFLSADGHKWMLGPEGCGILYVRKEVLERLGPSMTGWMGRPHPSDYEDPDQPLIASARRFETGSANMAGAAALGASLDLLSCVGIKAVWQRLDWLCEAMTIGLRQRGFHIVSPREEGERSGIISFTRRDLDPEPCVAQLARRKIFVSSRRGWIRVAPHFYNTPEQVEAFLDGVDHAAGEL